MDYIRSYKSFVNSHYLTEGLRMTVGILLPAFLMIYFGRLDIGIVVSLGAYFVSITDNPGPVHHRRNGMIACIVIVFCVNVIAGFTNSSPVLLGIFLIISCFLFSMIGVYGTRSSSVGLIALVALVLNIDQRQGWQTMEHALYVAAGGVWYACFSLLLYTFRPYKLLQQALGDSIQEIADYLRTRSKFYQKNVDYDLVYRELLQKQTTVQQKENMLSELIFKTRSVVKETTHIGRILVMMYLDTVDMFERIMTSYQSYSVLHDYFDETDILQQYHDLLIKMAADLDDIGIAVKSGRASNQTSFINEAIKKVRSQLDELRMTYMKADNIEGFISLRRILENIQDLADRLGTLHLYTTYDPKIKKGKRHDIDYDKLVSHDSISAQLLIDNISLKSDIFRHSLRISIATLAAYIVSLFFTIGHSYWILLTVIVLLKPAYSLTKKRNGDRLLGTVLGAIIGVIILQFVKNSTALLVVMIFLMAGNFVFMRKNYFISIFLMTSYMLLFFHLIYPTNFTALLKDRIIDTMIGSVVAFIASKFLFPSWERIKIKPVMVQMVEDAVQYFSVTAAGFAEQEIILNHQRQLARKNALVSLANLSDAFNRMLSEPKSEQKSISHIHQFVVLNHMLTSYIASLSAYLKLKTIPYTSVEFDKVIEHIRQHLNNTIKQLQGEAVVDEIKNDKENLLKLNTEADTLLERRRNELTQGQLETDTKQALFNLKSVVGQFNLVHKAAVDLQKLSNKIEV